MNYIDYLKSFLPTVLPENIRNRMYQKVKYILQLSFYFCQQAKHKISHIIKIDRPT